MTQKESLKNQLLHMNKIFNIANLAVYSEYLHPLAGALHRH